MVALCLSQEGEWVRSSSVLAAPAEAALDALFVHGYNIRRYRDKLQPAEVKHG